MKLHGPRLTLVALGADELAEVRWAPEDENARAFFLARLREDPGSRGWWAWVARLPDGEEVGNGGFGGRPGPDRRLTVGYSVHEEHRSQGYATEMLRLLTDWGLAQEEIDVVRATIRPDNAPSLKVAERAGFVATGETLEDEEHGLLLVYERR